MAGRLMSTEMHDQPRVLADLLARRAETIAQVKAVAPEDLRGVVLVARGSSDNAALHARYLMEVATGAPAVLAAPSLWTRYEVSTRLDCWVAVAVSQSGRTPEVVDTLSRMRAAGARAVMVTNGEATELHDLCDAVVSIRAGEERAVPATKTVTASMLALAHVAAALGVVPWSVEDERRLPDDVAAVLGDQGALAPAVDLLAGAQAVHLGRGFTYPVALEGALKLKETTLRPASAYATADFLHGPVAAAREGSALVGYAAQGPTFADILEVSERLRDRGVPSVLVTDAGPPTTLRPSLHVSVPAGLPEALLALPMTVRAQQLAWLLTMSAGLDPDAPSGLSKVTITT